MAKKTKKKVESFKMTIPFDRFRINKLYKGKPNEFMAFVKSQYPKQYKGVSDEHIKKEYKILTK